MISFVRGYIYLVDGYGRQHFANELYITARTRQHNPKLYVFDVAEHGVYNITGRQLLKK